jgi:hypothetical protein
MAIHEYGAQKKDGTIIPERSFIRSTIKENRAFFLSALKRIGALVAMEKDPDRLMSLLGLKAVGMVQAKISSGISPPIKQRTKDAKGGNSKPLIDTGFMRTSISHEVVVR